jgi:hypothetical protein
MDGSEGAYKLHLRGVVDPELGPEQGTALRGGQPELLDLPPSGRPRMAFTQCLRAVYGSEPRLAVDEDAPALSSFRGK